MSKKLFLTVLTIFSFFLILISSGYSVEPCPCDDCQPVVEGHITWANCVASGCGATNIYYGGGNYSPDYCVEPCPGWPYCDPTVCPIIDYAPAGCEYQGHHLNDSDYVTVCTNSTFYHYIMCISPNMVDVGGESCPVDEVCQQVSWYGINCVGVGPCPEGWYCKTNTTAAFRYADCSESTPIDCSPGICSNGDCIPAPTTTIPINQTVIPAIDVIEWESAGYGWALPFFTPLFIVSLVIAVISGVVGRIAGMTVGGITLMLFVLVFTLFGVYPWWVGIVFLIVSAFVVAKFITGMGK